MKRYCNKNSRFLKVCMLGGWLGCCFGFPELAAGSHVSVPDVLQNDSVLGDSVSVADTVAAKSVVADSLGADTVVAAPPANVFENEAIDFNPLELRMQKRYLKKGMPFETKHFYDHIFMGAMYGYDCLVPRGGVGNNNARTFGLFIGNHFTRLHALRLSGAYTTWELPDTRYRMKQAEINVDYLFDFSSYINGYLPYRRLSVSGVFGLGYMKNSYYGERHDMLKGQVGLQLNLRVGSNLHVFAEPYVAVSTGQVDVYSQPSVFDYDVLYGVRGGLALSLNPAERYRRDSIYNGNLFFELSQSMNFLMNGSLPFIKTLGTGYQISVGKWFDSMIGLRATGMVGDYYWTSVFEPATIGSPQYETLCKGASFAGRLEAMINPLNFFQVMRDQEHHRFDVNVNAGFEYGWKMNPKMGEETTLRCNYWGGTAALQFLYNADNGTSIFLEPRYVHGIYTIPYRNAMMDKKFTDQFMQIAAGVRIGRPLKKERQLYQGDLFERNVFVGASFGGNKHMRTLNLLGDGAFNCQTSVHAGYHLHPLASFRLRMEYLHFTRNATTPYHVDFMGMEKLFYAQWKHRTGYFETQLDYLLNLTNVYQGFNADRKLNVYALFGPGYSVCVNQGARIYSKEIEVGENPRPVIQNHKGEGAWSLTGGVLVDYKVHPRWSIFVDPQVQYYLKPNYVGGGSTSRLNDLFLKFSVGCSYQLFP